MPQGTLHVKRLLISLAGGEEVGRGGRGGEGQGGGRGGGAGEGKEMEMEEETPACLPRSGTRSSAQTDAVILLIGP